MLSSEEKHQHLTFDSLSHRLYSGYDTIFVFSKRYKYFDQYLDQGNFNIIFYSCLNVHLFTLVVESYIGYWFID